MSNESNGHQTMLAHQNTLWHNLKAREDENRALRDQLFLVRAELTKTRDDMQKMEKRLAEMDDEMSVLVDARDNAIAALGLLESKDELAGSQVTTLHEHLTRTRLQLDSTTLTLADTQLQLDSAREALNGIYEVSNAVFNSKANEEPPTIDDVYEVLFQISGLALKRGTLGQQPQPGPAQEEGEEFEGAESSECVTLDEALRRLRASEEGEDDDSDSDNEVVIDEPRPWPIRYLVPDEWRAKINEETSVNA